MARIPVYQERQQVSQSIGVPQLSAPDSGAGAIGRSMQQLGQSLGQVSNTLATIEDNNGRAYAVKASGQAKQEMTRYFLESQEAAPPGASGFTKKFDAEFQTYANKLLEQAPDGSARRFLATSLENLRGSLSSQSLMFEATETRAHRFSEVAEGIKSTANALFQNPSQEEYEKSRGELQAGVDAQTLTPNQKRQLFELIDQSLTDATINGQIRINPNAFLDSVDSATGSNVDRKKLTTAMISVESAGKTTAVSPKGATGLMQVMPATAADPGFNLPNVFEFAQSIGVEFSGKTTEEATRLLKMPEVGARYGEMYMDAMIEKYNGNLVYALAAYNWGPGNTNRWIAQGADPSKLPEETRKYIPKVLSKAGVSANMDGKPTATGNAAFDNLPFEKQMQYIDRATTRSKQLQAEYRVQFENQLSDSAAMAMNGIVDERTLTLDEFVSAYGAEKGLQNFNTYRETQTMAGDIGMLKTMPLDQISERVEAYKPEAGEGFDLAQKRYDIMRQSAARVIQMRNDDPVRYAQDTNPDVQESLSAYQKIGADPSATIESIGTALQDYVAKSMAEQQRLGVAEPKVLSNVELDNLSRRIATGNENAANLVVSIEATYGANYFPQVMDELLAAGKLSNAMVVIADLPNAGAREAVARIANIPRADLEKGVDSVDIKDIKMNTTAVVQELRATSGPVTEETAKALAAYQDIIEKLALEFISGATSNPSDAVDMAKKLVLGHYQFDGSLRMPANMDRGYIKQGLNSVIDAVRRGTYLTIADVPQDLTQAYNEQEALKLWQSAVENNHYWVATNDTKAASLWVRAENGMSYKVFSDGIHYNYAFDAAQAWAIENREQSFSGRIRMLSPGGQ